MHKNQIWLALLASLTLVVLWFTISTGLDLYVYTTQDSTAKPQSITWSVRGVASDKYYLKADYTFLATDTLTEGSTDFDSTMYKNHRAAESVIPTYQDKEWTVWYHSDNLSSSSLQKFFPIKSCVYTLILWGVLLYFIWLGFYVGKMNMHTMVDNGKDYS